MAYDVKVNQAFYSFATIEFEIGGLIFASVVEINYSDAVKPGRIMGTGGVVIGRTPGTSKPTMNFTVARHAWDQLREQLVAQAESTTLGNQATYATTAFTARVTYSEPAVDGDPKIEAMLVTDIIDGVRVIGPSAKNQQGNKPTQITLDCDVIAIRWGRTGGSDGVLALPDDGDGAEVQVNDPVTGANVPAQGSSTWWAKYNDGFWAAGDGIHAPNPYDTITIAGIQLPGLCRTKASTQPSRVIDEQKPNGSDAAALIDRGYRQAVVEVEVTLWMRSHLSAWEGAVRELWTTPGKSSRFEAPQLQVAPSTAPATPGQQSAQIQRANVPIAREIAAINAGRQAYEARACDIVHSALGIAGITKAIVESVGVLEPGPEPQTFVSRIRLRQYLPAVTGKKHTTHKIKGSVGKSLEIHQVYQYQTPANQAVTRSGDPSYTPADTEGGPFSSSP